METVAQISTPPGVGGISIIKVSGDRAIEEVNTIFKGQDLTQVESHTLNYGFIIDNNKKIDEVLIGVMHGPKTYTGEDIVEINCHGGVLITQKILQILLKKNIQLAQAGEFTKRAFLNGKKSIDEVNTIMDLIHAKNEEALNIAISSLNTSSITLIETLREKILDIVTNIEVNIDYPEYEDLKVVKHIDVKQKIDDFIELTTEIINDSKSGEILKNGIKTTLLGKPNVGKSSILNYLSKNDKAIVTNIAGTTRDIIESELLLGGITLNLIDTAGIRTTDDVIEKIGVTKSLEQITNSELILFVLDNTSTITDDEKQILDKILQSKTKYIIIINKAEEPTKLFLDDLPINKEQIIKMSTYNKYGEKELANTIKEIFNLQYFDSQNSKHVSNLEHITKLEIVLENMKKTKEDLNNDLFLDLILIDLKESLFILSDILGLNPKEDFLNEMFSRFCLGK